uniref:Uncharacterized protein n=1 Tax=Ditylenchus dipsaci TaxID=166011 RepID=A0A915CMV2_9BILA
MVGNLIALFEELPIPEYNKCRVLQCIFKKTGLLTYTYTRMCVGFLNFLAGTYFLLKIWQLEKVHLQLTTSNVVFMQETPIEKNSTVG